MSRVSRLRTIVGEAFPEFPDKLVDLLEEADGMAVLVTNRNMRTIYCSEAYADRLGFDPDYFIGLLPATLAPESPDREGIDPIQRCFELGEAFEGQRAVVHSSGRHIWSHYSMTPILDEDEDLIEYWFLRSEELPPMERSPLQSSFPTDGGPIDPSKSTARPTR